MQRSFHIITFGCQMNVNDSQWLANALRQRGFYETSIKDASFTIINTCSVRDKPEQKVYNTIRRIAHETKHNPHAFCIVAGCVAQQIGDKFFDNFKNVRLVSGGDGIASLPTAIEKLYENSHLKISLVDFSESYPERELNLENSSPMAYVNIMQGCDNFCAYCIVPYTRGRQKSRHTDAILEECQALINHGTKEICLLGQNVNSFGQDKQGDGTSFAELLKKISAISGLERLRFMTPHPKDFSDDVIECFKELDNLCPRIHLPLQAGSDRILKAMGRKYDSKRFLDLVHKLRAANPKMAFSSDIIVGFPGESEEDFMQTCHMLEQVNFMASFSFCYSDRPGTRASMLKDKIDKEVAQDRLLRLQALQDKLSETWLQTRVGEQCQVLLENKSKKNSINGHDMQENSTDLYEYWQGKDIYGTTINMACEKNYAKIGLLTNVKIVTAKKHTLVGEVIK